MVGHTVAHYRIIDQLGAGGMGVVYKAEDLRLGRAVALKFLPPQLSRDRAAAERFEREARTASSLNHPNICTIYGIDEFEGQRFIAMELLDGQSLGNAIGGRPLPIERVLEYGIQIADALDAAHAQGILHRDIKPANIFITRRGQVKVLDFGLAKLASPAGFDDASADSPTIGMLLSTQGVALGTVAYMSPEQARGEPLDPRTDLFSFGIVLYEMATGHQAFPGQTSAVVFDSILNRMPVPTASLCADVPPQLDQIISKALEKDRSLRYQTASDMHADLRRLRRDRESGRVVISGAVPAVSGASTGSHAAHLEETIAVPVAAPALAATVAASAASGAMASGGEPPSAGAADPSVPAPAPAQEPSARRTIGLGWAAAAVVLLVMAGIAAAAVAFVNVLSGGDSASGAPVAGDAPPAQHQEGAPEPVVADGSGVLAETGDEEDEAAASPSVPAAHAPPVRVPESPPARLGRAATDRADRVRADADEAAREDPPAAAVTAAANTPAVDPAVAMLSVARAKAEARLYDQAAADLEALVQQHPASASAPAALLALAQVRAQQSRADDAMAVYVELRSRYRTSPAAAEAGVRFAELMLRTNQPDRVRLARDTLSAVARDYPDSPWAPRALAARGDLELREKIREVDKEAGGVVPAALVTWRDLSVQYPDAAESEAALWKLAAAYEELRRYDYAAQTYVRLATHFPETRYDAWWKAGELYDRRLRNREAARGAYLRVPESSRNYREAQRRTK